MYRYDEFDHRLRRRARRAVPRPGAAPPRRRADRGRVQAAAADERPLPAASRLHAAGRRSLWRAVLAADAQARAYRATLRQGLRPFHHAPEHPVQLAEAERRAGSAGRAGRGRDARHPDQRQLHPQHHRRPVRRRRGRRDRGPAPLRRDHPAVVDPASGIQLPAAQVQDRGDRRAARPRRDQAHDIGIGHGPE